MSDKKNDIHFFFVLISILFLVSSPDIKWTNYHSCLETQDWNKVLLAVLKVEKLPVQTGSPPFSPCQWVVFQLVHFSKAAFFSSSSISFTLDSAKWREKHERICWSSCPMSFNWMVPAISFNRALSMFSTAKGCQ